MQLAVARTPFSLSRDPNAEGECRARQRAIPGALIPRPPCRATLAHLSHPALQGVVPLTDRAQRKGIGKGSGQIEDRQHSPK
jgi:hypothetical protein